jgi:hypothetical protein
MNHPLRAAAFFNIFLEKVDRSFRPHRPKKGLLPMLDKISKAVDRRAKGTRLAG